MKKRNEDVEDEDEDEGMIIRTTNFIYKKEIDFVMSSFVIHEPSQGTGMHRRVKSSMCVEGEAFLPEQSVEIPRSRSQSLFFSSPVSRSLYSSLPESPAVTFLQQFAFDDRENCPRVVFKEGAIVDKYVVGKVIGRGTFSECRLGQLYAEEIVDDGNSMDLALKIIQPMQDEPEVMSECRREIEIWSRLDHPHILPLIESVFVDGACMCVTPLCTLGNLSKYISENGSLDEQTAKRIFAQACSAIDYLHTEHRIVHRDIKLDNILLDDHFRVKLCDFGLSENVDDLCCPFTDWEYRGTPAYIPPELIENHQSSSPNDAFRSDIWALGVVLYAMLTGELPFKDEYAPRLYQSILERRIKPLPRQFSSDLHILLDCLLERDPSRRPPASIILRSPWLKRI